MPSTEDAEQAFPGDGEMACRMGLPVKDLASQVMAALARSSGYEDDVALVLYRHPATE
jgi:hypothetical protein